MSTSLKILVGFLSFAVLAALAALSWLLFQIEAHLEHGPYDYQLLAGVGFAIAYFVAAFVTCLPRFPASKLQLFGIVLHLFIAPLSLAFIWSFSFHLPSGSLGRCAGITLLWLLFAAVWSAMARSAIHSSPEPRATPVA